MLRGKSLQVFLALITFLNACVAFSESTPSYEAQRLDPSQTWIAYVEAEQDEAKTYVEEKFVGTFLSSLPPKSELVRALHVDSHEIYADYAKLNLSMDLGGGDSHRAWFAMALKQGKWQLTLDETPVLNRIASIWNAYDIGPIVYRFNGVIAPEWHEQMQASIEDYHDLEDAFESNPGKVDFFIARSASEAEDIYVEESQGAGAARYRSLKAYNVAKHRHEMVHVFANEFGSVGPLIDEGIATALGNDILIDSSETCDDVRDLLQQYNYTDLLDASIFRLLQRQGRNVYAIAQQILLHWIDLYGMPEIKNLLSEGVNNPHDVEEYIARELELPQVTNHILRSRIDQICEDIEQT